VIVKHPLRAFHPTRWRWGIPLEGPLKIYPVSDLVNSPKTDDARCIEPVPTARKSVVNS
jgi:putative SOS response-associated peptidase YedK